MFSLLKKRCNVSMTKKITVYGLVQGFGFRPYIKRLAIKYGIGGNVRNTDGVVQITAIGNEAALKDFETAIIVYAPEGSRIDKIDVEETFDTQWDERNTFEIIKSSADRVDSLAYVPADIATCRECERELKDTQNRRYRHPFISCALCGPRYSIMDKIPYDRENTMMDDFAMCPECRTEYENTDDRRCYAQTIACPDCGPQLTFNGNRDDCIEKAADVLKAGRIVAIKDIGGYHFACDAFNDDSVMRLREIKLREAKPFAIMFSGVEQIREYADVSKQEEELLCSPERPIVLLKVRSEGKRFADSVCGKSRYVGAMLPCNPVQIMLMEQCGPLVMTSGNISGEPIITDDTLMSKLAAENDFDVLAHNRDIEVPLDDSVARIICGKIQVVRRGRGYTPAPLDVESDAGRSIFAAGGDLKAAFAIASGKRIILSEHFGDLENPKAFDEYVRQIAHMESVYGFVPDKILCDMHPGYFSSGYAKKNSMNIEVKEIQHHIAHIASVAAEHQLVQDYVGFAFDGTGYGPDGAVWGGEVFGVCGNKLGRRYHLEYMKMPSSDESAKNAGLLAQYYMCQAGAEDHYLTENNEEINIIKKALELGINVADTSSMGRLFDVVSAITGVCAYNRYEGECASMLEKEACRWEDNQKTDDNVCVPEIRFHITDKEILVRPLIRAVCKAVSEGVDKSLIAYEFHMAVIDLIAQICHKEKAKNIVVSGGVFMNRIIMDDLWICGLREEGVNIFFNGKIPATDGGIAVGQIWAEERGYELCV